MSQVTQDVVEQYKNNKNIKLFYFQTRDKNGNEIDIDGVVSPLERDNRDLVSPIENQGSKPFCAAYSVCTIFESMYWKYSGKLLNIDQDHVYARAKQLDGNSEDGTYLESAIQACAELMKINPYNVNMEIYYNDHTNKTIEHIKHLIHKYDLIHAGFLITSAWYECTNSKYIIQNGGINQGGHAVVISGYDQTGVYITNSWGKEWGATGMAILPWNLVLPQLMYCAVFTVPNLKI